MNHNRKLSVLATAAAVTLAGTLGAAGCEGEAEVGQEAVTEDVRQTTALGREADEVILVEGAEAAEADIVVAQRDVAEGEAQLAAGQVRERKQWQQPPAMQIDSSKNYTATIKTNMGEVVVDLFEKDAPKTVNNFVFLAQEDFYDGTIFHRIIDNFMIQGGDPTGTGTGGPGYTFEDETRGNPNRHEPYTLSMANAGPNTNGSQFFITDTATPHLDGRHTVFGRVTGGREVVDKMSAVRTGPRDKPVQDVVIEDVTINEGGGGATTQPAQ